MTNKHHKDAPFECPGCGARVDMATNVYETGAPEPGNFTICLYCAAMLVYDRHGVVPLSDAAYRLLDVETQFALQRVRQEVMAAKVTKPR